MSCDRGNGIGLIRCPGKTVWFLLITGLLMVIARPVPASSLNLEDLLERLAPAGETIEHAYRESRESTLLTEAVTTKGTIRYRSPGYLHKTEEDSEGRRTIVIEEDTVRVERNGEKSTFPVDRFRTLEALMLLLDAVARADAERLRERFEMELEGEIGEWTLLLRSRHEAGNDSRRERRAEGEIRLDVLGDEQGIRRIVLDSPDSGRVTFEIVGDRH